MRFSSINRRALAANSLRASVTGFLLMHSAAVRCSASCGRCCIMRRKSPSVTMPSSLPLAIHDGGEPEPLAAHFVNHVGHFRAGRNAGKIFARVHQSFETTQTLAEFSAGMQGGEIFFLEAAALEQRNRQRIAHGERRSSGGGGREIQRAGFFFHGDVEHDVARLRKRGARLAR